MPGPGLELVRTEALVAGAELGAEACAKRLLQGEADDGAGGEQAEATTWAGSKGGGQFGAEIQLGLILLRRLLRA